MGKPVSDNSNRAKHFGVFLLKLDPLEAFHGTYPTGVDISK